jgi:3-hydroxyisobutyrate dehydrogenase-like beta-hydroxyacid dehydrogenase
MATLAFLGLGQMGARMAARLLDAGHNLTVWNRTAEKAVPLVEQGARQADTPAGAAAGVDAAVTMLADPDALREVLFGKHGLAEGLAPGATLIEMSTVGPEAVREVAARLSEGTLMLDAPVLGSLPEAAEGRLKVFVGGPADLYERWSPMLAAFGQPRHLGDLGSGAAMKLVVNSTLGALMTGLAEALALGDALGLDQPAMLDVLSDSAIGATARGKRSRIESGEYPPNFTLSLAAKDLGLVVEAASRAGLELRVAAAARSWLADADSAGLGALDYSAVVAHARGAPARLPS